MHVTYNGECLSQLTNQPENTEMLTSVWAEVRDGKIELVEPAELPEGSKVLVTLFPNAEHEFWCGASQESLAAVWDNTEDDVYGQLLAE